MSPNPILPPGCPAHCGPSDEILLSVGRLEGSLDILQRSISERFDSLDGKLEVLDHKVFGNGRPGAIKELSDRARKLEDWRLEVEQKQKVVRKRAAFINAVLVALFGSGGGAAMQFAFNYLRSKGH